MLGEEKTKLSETRSLLEKEVAKHQATKSELKSEVSRFKVIIEDLNLEKQNHQITKSKLDDLVINNVLKSAVTNPKLVKETSQNNYASPTVLPVLHDLLKSNQSTIAKPKSVQEKSQNNLGQNRWGQNNVGQNNLGQNNLGQNNLGQNNLSMIREERSRSVSPNKEAWPPHGKFQRDRWKYNQGDTSKTAKNTSSLGKNTQNDTSKTPKNTASLRKYGGTWTNI